MKNDYLDRYNQMRTEILGDIYRNGTTVLVSKEDEEFSDKLFDLPIIVDTDRHANFYLRFGIHTVIVNTDTLGMKFIATEMGQEWEDREYDANECDLDTLIDLYNYLEL